MNCSICKKPITLVPSARERAQKFGGTPSDYTRLFTAHASCELLKRTDDTLALMRSITPHPSEIRMMSKLGPRTTPESN